MQLQDIPINVRIVVVTLMHSIRNVKELEWKVALALVFNCGYNTNRRNEGGVQ